MIFALVLGWILDGIGKVLHHAGLLCLAPSGLTIAFSFTQGVARLRRTCPGLVYSAPSGLTLHNKTFVKPTRKNSFFEVWYSRGMSHAI